jgi:CIC family chloride channel protein
VEKVIEAGIYLSPDDTLEDAMPIFENADTSFIPIVEVHPSKDLPSLLGVLYQTDALKKYNFELVSRVKEEHS